MFCTCPANSDKLPDIIDKISLGFTYWSELIIPFMIFFPRRMRRIAFFSLIIFQTLIIMTGNYGFFNLLTIVICVTLIDDQLIEGFTSKWLVASSEVNTVKTPTEKIKIACGVFILACFISSYAILFH